MKGVGYGQWGKRDVPCASADIGLDSHDAVLVDERMGLADNTHYGVPGTFLGVVSNGKLSRERGGCVSGLKVEVFKMRESSDCGNALIHTSEPHHLMRDSWQ